MWLIDLLKNLFQRDKEEDSGFPGLVESPIDYRDILSGSIQEFVGIPEEYEIPYKLKVTHQYNTPRCVGHSGAKPKEEKERREQNFIDFDPDFLFEECKKIDGLSPEFKGTTFRALFKVLQKVGAMPVGQEWDYDIAAKYRIGGYAKIEPLTFESLKQAIYQNGVVLSGFRGSNSGWRTAYIRPLKAGETSWGHATALIKYILKFITGQNSWGPKWGDEGRFHFDKNYLPFSAWVVLVDLPNNWKELIGKDKPKPRYVFLQNLWIGMKNNEVKILQDCLKWKGCFPLDIESTGYFGRLTLEGTKLFQTRYSIRPVSGYVGPLTRTQLNKIFS